MAELWYGHFDSTDEDERLLLAEDWARYIRGFVTDGIRNGGSCLQVTADTGMKLKLDAGVATVQGYMMEIRDDFSGRYYPLELEPAHPSLPRIDRVVIRLDRTIAVRRVVPEILIGTAGSNPTAPALTRNQNIWELSLAQIRVNGGAANITDSNITDERFQTDLCGLMNSVLGLDPSAWQNQFDEFISEIQNGNIEFLVERLREFDEQLEAQQTAFETQYNGQKGDWEAWFTSVQSNLSIYAGFDFDNQWLYPATKHETVFNADGSITDTLKTVDGGKNVASKQTVFNPDGSIMETLTVYGADYTTVLLKRSKTTEFNADGSIKDEVIDI